MRWPVFFKRSLHGCFGDNDEPIDPGPAPPNRRVVATQQSVAKPAKKPPQAEQLDGVAVARTSGMTPEPQRSEQQSEQSQSDATRPTTQPTSTGSSVKVESDPDEITPTKAVPLPTASVANAQSDPDAITPVIPPAPMYQNVKQALEDRQSLYERLRRPLGEIQATEPQQASQQSSSAHSHADGTQAVVGEGSGS